jgi:ABC-2 type transport system permease protein
MTAGHPGWAISRLLRVAAAFLRLGFRQAISYPLGFVTGQLGAVLPVFIYFFVARLIPSGESVGGDYFTFVVIGLVAMRFLEAGLRGFAFEMDVAINRGWLEMFLVEPIRWRFLPFGMAQWPTMQAVIGSSLVLAVSLPLGVDIRWRDLPSALWVLVLGLAAGLAIGTFSASLKVLAKSGDPILFVYHLAAQILSGVYFSLEVLPGPLRMLSWLIPHTYVISALRSLLMAEPSRIAGPSLEQSVNILLVFCVIAYPMALWLFGRSLEYGRKLGVLSGY